LVVVNKHAYKPPVHDIMEKYYEMFRGKNQANNKDLFNNSDSPDDLVQDSDEMGTHASMPRMGVTRSHSPNGYVDATFPLAIGEVREIISGERLSK